jgi:hypothetical protein
LTTLSREKSSENALGISWGMGSSTLMARGRCGVDRLWDGAFALADLADLRPPSVVSGIQVEIRESNVTRHSSLVTV